MNDIRVRFAPSPTGTLHIGGVRTALFNFLYARSQGGKFLLRIEDTDLERSEKVYEDEILDSLNWLGLNPDEELVRQSTRFDYYRECARALVDQGKAYVSTEKGGEAVLFKVPKQQVFFYDLVHGKIEFDTGTFDDLVLIKSDGSPTWTFACVIDDYEMKVSHVIRGDDHISNTPKQILLYEALGYTLPKFGHLPLILGDDGTPLSKRHGAVATTAYREQGYLSQGLLNYLALLGWGPGKDRELFTFEALQKEFRIKRVNSTAAAFNVEKLRWVNSEHLRMLDGETYTGLLRDFVEKKLGLSDPHYLGLINKTAVLFKERIKTFQDYLDLAGYLFTEDFEYEPEAVKKHWDSSELKPRFEALVEALNAADFSVHEAIEAVVRDVAVKLDVHARELIHPIRVAITGKYVSPGLFELMSALGKEIVLKRLQKAADNVDQVRKRALSA